MNEPFHKLINLLALRKDQAITDSDFLAGVDNAAPGLLDSWARYIRADGDYTLDDCFMPPSPRTGNHARQEATKRRLGDREKLFLHLHHHETRAGSGTLIGIARQYIAGGKIRHASAESLTRDYRRWRRTVKAHPAGDKLHRSPADP